MSNEIGSIVASTVNRTVDRQTSSTDSSSGKTPSALSVQSSDKVTLTSEARAMQSAQVALANTPQVDTTRVQNIKLSLSQGTYQIDSTRVANQMMSFESSLVAATPVSTGDPVAGDAPDSRLQHNLSIDPESGTITRSFSATREDGTTMSREISLTRTDEGVSREASFDNGRGVTRDASASFDADTRSYTRDVTYAGPNGGGIEVSAKGHLDEGSVNREIHVEGGRGQPVR